MIDNPIYGGAYAYVVRLPQHRDTAPTASA
jgi:hypothetical protein